MVCYKCGATKNLSIKARHRNGSVRIRICRDCRNAASKQYKEAHDYVPVPAYEITKQLEWEDAALENYIRISRKWA